MKHTEGSVVIGGQEIKIKGTAKPYFESKNSKLEYDFGVFFTQSQAAGLPLINPQLITNLTFPFPVYFRKLQMFGSISDAANLLKTSPTRVNATIAIPLSNTNLNTVPKDITYGVNAAVDTTIAGSFDMQYYSLELCANVFIPANQPLALNTSVIFSALTVLNDVVRLTARLNFIQA